MLLEFIFIVIYIDSFMRDQGFDCSEAYVWALTGSIWMFVIHMVLSKTSLDFAYPWKGIPWQRPSPAPNDRMFSIDNNYAMHDWNGVMNHNAQLLDYQTHSAWDNIMTIPYCDLIITIGLVTVVLMASVHLGIPVGIDLSSGSIASDEIDYFDS